MIAPNLETIDRLLIYAEDRITLRKCLLGIAVLLVLLVIAYVVWWFWVSDSPHAHQTVRAAEARCRRIEKARKAVDVTLVSMRENLDEFKVPASGKTYTLTEIRDLSVELSELTDTLTKQYNALVECHEQFQHELQEKDFRDAAEVWRQYASEETSVGYTEIAQRYEEVATLWDQYADAVKASKNDPLNIQELDAVMRFVQRARLMLDRLAAHIDGLPIGEAFRKKADLEKNLRLFLGRFDELRAAIRGLTDQLHQKAEPEQPPHNAAQSPATAPDPNAAIAKAVAPWALVRLRRSRGRTDFGADLFFASPQPETLQANQTPDC